MPIRMLIKFARTLLLVSLLLAGLNHSLRAQPDVLRVTNLLQLRQSIQHKISVVANISLTGVVCAASARSGLLVLSANGMAEQLEMDLAGNNFSPGQIVRVSGERCEVLRRRTGIGLRRLPLVDNDGLHGVREATNSVALAAGRHPIKVEWFNAGGPAALKVQYSGPGFSRRNIPDESLAHEDFSPETGGAFSVPGLAVQSYEGLWRVLPDFGRWPEAGHAGADNFLLATLSPGESIGRVYSGQLLIKEPGTYTFYLASDDGSRLFLGEPQPQLEVIGQQLPEPALKIYVGQVTDINSAARWATVEGNVSYVGVSGRRLELELRSPSNNRLQVDVMDSTGLPSGLLLNAKVRVTGVARPVTIAGDQSIIGLLTTPGEEYVQLLDLPADVWLGQPLAKTTNASLTTDGPAVVRVAGKIEASADASQLRLSDDMGSLSLRNNATTAAWIGREAEVLGAVIATGTNRLLTCVAIRARVDAPTEGNLPTLTSAQQVLHLDRAEAAKGYPVKMRGVITCTWPDDRHNAVVQDATRGIFVLLPDDERVDPPQFGDFCEIIGRSAPGNFSPVIRVSSWRRISAGRLPEPIQPAWDQIINGSLDNQYVEIEGVIIKVEKRALTMLSHWGKSNITLFGESPPHRSQSENQLVRLRGCLQALWDGRTHQVQVGGIRFGNLAINTDRDFSADPFAVPERQVPDLRLYDPQANAFRRVRIRGQFLQRHEGESFMMSSANGVRFITSETLDLQLGDQIEVVGVPDLLGPAPILREAIVRKLGGGSLPASKVLNNTNLLQADNDSVRVRVDGTLLNLQRSRAELVLELRDGLHVFAARMPLDVAVDKNLVPGCRLRVTGVYASHASGRVGTQSVESFDLLVSSAGEIQVLSRPPWWTFKRLLLATAVLLGILTLSGVWIFLLRRQVERRTAQLERANRQREQAERARALEEERLRIARDLHDDLGSSLTEITMLGGMGLTEQEAERGNTISQIVKKARDSVNALDVIVWAVNPKENTLQSLADYLASFADEFLTASGITCRLNLPMSFPAVTLDGRSRHDLFLATKEALNNAVRHARATEVELSIALEQAMLIIGVRDNGTGFDQSAKTFGHGLGNLQSRLEKLGGQCQIESVSGGGTSVTLKLPLPSAG